MDKKVRLVDIHGATRTWIDAEITENGDLPFSGQDVGEAPEQYWHDSDYEYWPYIDAKDKDRVLLALIERLYHGRLSVITEFKDFLASKGISSEFSSYV